MHEARGCGFKEGLGKGILPDERDLGQQEFFKFTETSKHLLAFLTILVMWIKEK